MTSEESILLATPAEKVAALARLKAGLADPTPRGCREWRHARSSSGYGSMGAFGSVHSPHRLLWLLVRGAVAPGICVLHACDNRLCAELSHLFLGTRADNSRDMARKARGGGTRLTWTQVAEIRERRSKGETLEAIGRAYGVGKSNVWGIVHDKTWRHE